MDRSGRILVVDDEAHARSALAALLRDEGYQVETARDASEALEQITRFAPDLVITDLKMPGMGGIELVAQLRGGNRDERGQGQARAGRAVAGMAMSSGAPAVIVMTAHGAVATAIAAMRAGAEEYLTKPLNIDELLVVIDKALRIQALRRETAQLKDRVRGRLAPQNLIGASPPMQRVFEVIEQVAPSRATVLITGESGTGKELVASAIHQRSPRRDGPFIKLHCAALAESLLESELFGHEKGAFTGALERRDGRFALADRGTIFLDEIGEVSPAIQVKLLRFVQQHEFERVGGSQTLRVDVRVIAATNRDLRDLVARGQFREDLFYRLNVVNLEMPALRARRSDIPALASLFLARYAADNGKAIDAIAPAVLERLIGHDWPGNVRELENAIESAVVLASGPQLELRDLPLGLRPPEVSGAPPIPGSTMAELERYAILETLKAAGGSTSKAAEILGISARTIQYRLHDYQAAPRGGGDVVKPRTGDGNPDGSSKP